MTCFFCKGEMKPSTTIHTVQLKNCVVVIKNVPCLKCEQCGEVVLSADTVEKIEHILQTVEKAVAEITVEYLEKKEEERFDYYAWRDQMIREHYADFEAAGYFDRHPEQRPSLEPRTNPEESTPPGEV